MAITMTCPNGHILRLPEKAAGKSARCPKCQAVLEVPGVDETAKPVADSAEEERRDEEIEQEKDERKVQRRRERRRRLNLVQIGVTLHLIQILMIAIMIPVSFGLLIMAARSKGEGRAVIALVIIGGMWMVIETVGIVGSVLCLMVPKAASARTAMAMSLGLHVANLALGGSRFIVLTTGVVDSASTGVVHSAFVLVGDILQFGSWLTFMFFLNRLAIYIRVRYLEDDSEAVMRFGIMFWLLRILLTIGGVLLKYLFCLGALIELGLGIALLVVAILFLIKYVSLLLGFRHALQ